MKIKSISNFLHGASEKTFGFSTDGQAVTEYQLANKNGMTLSAITYGGTVTSLKIPLKNGRIIDVVLGFDTLQDYISSYNLPSAPYFGAAIGRFAGRIAGGSCFIGDKKIILDANDNGNILHGGFIGFSQKIWEVKRVQPGPNPSVTFSLVSPDGDSNFPGKLTVEMTYMITEENEFSIEYKAFTSQDTLVNLTHHSYFNLGGHKSDATLQQMTVNATNILEKDNANIPTGALIGLENHAFDFSKPRNCPANIDDTFVLDGQYGLAATLFSPETRLRMQVLTNQPGVHIYVGGNCFNRIKGKENTDYNATSGICFETQHFPDAPHHANFPDTLLAKDSIYYHKTIYKFQSL